MVEKRRGGTRSSVEKRLMLAVRMDQALYDALARWSVHEDRSLASQARRVLASPTSTSGAGPEPELPEGGWVSLTVRISPDQRAAIDTEAQARGWTTSDVVRARLAAAVPSEFLAEP